MKLLLGILMNCLFVPTIIAMFFLLYPKNWKKHKTIFGVLNRDEFKAEAVSNKVDEIVANAKNAAFKMMVCGSILSVLCVFIPDMTAMMIIFCIVIVFGLFAFQIPFVKGNEELKSLKRELGIQARGGTKSADLRSINASHALKKSAIIIPAVISVIGFAVSLLYDLKVIKFGDGSFQGSFGLTIFSGVFLFLVLLFWFVASIIDNVRNEIISEDSDVNVNYNRAKKKIWADFSIWNVWLIVVLLIAGIICCALGVFEMFQLIGILVLIVGIMAIMVITSSKLIKLSSIYKFESPLDDDDDNWKYGMFYYNPNDPRLNVEKRAGLGATVNMAHPVGKVLLGVMALSLVVLVLSLVYIGLLDNTRLDLRVENGQIICHQFHDEYKIDIDDIKEITFNEDMKDMKIMKISGVGTDKVLKGRFAINKDSNCKTFMNPKVGCYLRIDTSKGTYYLNDSTADETREIYEMVK
ncbi:MAG: DUF5808 domain-containing protein [Lachnospiraceae bacterium]|nr:DUF5808 domain-containing protein [Lachnospiraceae bacterium]